MSLCLEIQPQRYAIVVGPNFAAEVVKEALHTDSDDVKLPAYEFRSIVNHGVSYLLDKETFASDTERAKFEARYKNAYELDPVFVLRKIISSLQTAGCYKEWLTELYACKFPTNLKESRSLQRLLTLQSQGALLVYVHCDDILARAAGQEPVLLNNEKQMERWAKGECVGFLQPHGVYTEPDTVQLNCQLYDSDAPTVKAEVERLKQFLCSRSTILLGDDWSKLSSDPLLANFCKRFVSESTERHSFVLGTTANDSALPGLPVYATTPCPAVYPLTDTSKELWKQINVVPTLSSQYQVVCLLVTSQTGAREISLMMFNAPGVNFALMNPVTYGDSTVFCVSVRVSSGSLHQLWHWLLVSSNDTLLECGTVGLALDGGTFLWLRDPATITQGSQETDDNCCNSSSPIIDNSNTAVSTNSFPSPQDVDPQTTPTPTSPSHLPGNGGSDVRHNKIIQRYKVVKKRNQVVGSGGHSDASPYGSHLVTKACQDTGMFLSHHIPHLSKYARRGSLPPMKCGETGNAVALLAERIQMTADAGPGSTGPLQMPSYVAIKRALLSDKFKHMQNPISRLVVPKMLLNLLQAKKLSASESKSNLLAHRRNSDPGSYLQHRDKARRRQLFIDENMLWIKTYGSIIEKKIQTWKRKRLLKMQREYFYSQQEKLGVCHQQNELRFLNPAAVAQLAASSSLYGSLASSTAPSSLSSLPQAFVTAAAGSGVTGFSPLMYQLPSAGLTPTPVLLPAPFISPYTLMGSYTTLPVTAATQPTATYIVPPTALAGAGTQHKVVFLPSASCATAVGNTTPATTASDTKPPFSSLLAPTAPYHAKSEPESRHHVAPDVSHSLGSRKRKSAFPEKLSSLLQPPPDANPTSPPSEKRLCTTDHAKHPIIGHRHSSSSPPPSPSTHDHQTHHSSLHSHHHHHHHRHHYTHHSSSTYSSHHHHSTSSHSHHHHHSTSPPPHPHSYNSPSSLEQCLLQPPASPTCDGRTASTPGGSPCSLPPSPPANYSGHTHPQLWQFLLELLLAADCSHLIQWTSGSQEYEFTIHDPVQVAQLWGKCTNNSAMNYDKLVRGLHYYYSKGIIGKVDGKKLTYRYNGQAKSYVQRRCGQAVDVTSSMEEMVVVE